MRRTLLALFLLAPATVVAQVDGDPLPSEPAPPAAPLSPPEGMEPKIAFAGQEPLDLFHQRALRLQVRGGDVRVTRGGERVKDVELRALTAGVPGFAERWEAIDDTDRKTDVIMALGVGGCLASPACGGILGGVLGVASSVSYTYAVSQQLLLAPLTLLGAFVSGVVAGVCGGCLLGGLVFPVALGLNMVVDAVSDTDLKPEEYARLITDYNRRLARSLELDPATLDPEYFPADS